MDSYVLYPNGVKLPAMARQNRTSENDARFSVSQLQDIVGGYIGILDIGESLMVYNDEDDDLPLNLAATKMAMAADDQWHRYITGPVLICERGMIKV